MEAASKELKPLGMGVTWRMKDRTYSEKVPSTVKPEYSPLAQTKKGNF